MTYMCPGPIHVALYYLCIIRMCFVAVTACALPVSPGKVPCILS